MTGRLWLIAAGADYWSDAKIFGYTNVDLGEVGAPLDATLGPAPDARDPDAPGVLLEVFQDNKDYPADAPVLVVGTVSNFKPEPGYISLDGAGIGLFIHQVTDSGFSGRWSEWGLLVDGRGVFCAKRINGRHAS